MGKKECFPIPSGVCEYDSVGRISIYHFSERKARMEERMKGKFGGGDG